MKFNTGLDGAYNKNFQRISCTLLSASLVFTVLNLHGTWARPIQSQKPWQGQPHGGSRCLRVDALRLSEEGSDSLCLTCRVQSPVMKRASSFGTMTEAPEPGLSQRVQKSDSALDGGRVLS